MRKGIEARCHVATVMAVLLTSLLMSALVWLAGGAMAWVIVAGIRLFDALFAYKLMPFGLLVGFVEAFTDFPPVFTYSSFAGIVAFPIGLSVFLLRHYDADRGKAARDHTTLAERNEAEIQRLRSQRERGGKKEIEPSQWLPR